MTGAFASTKYRPLWIGAASLIALPFAMHVMGLSINTATAAVILAIAALGLNLLIGYTGLTSFGHSAWFGIGAYAAGLIQKNWLPGQIFIPLILSMLLVAAASLVTGALILRRRGVSTALLA